MSTKPYIPTTSSTGRPVSAAMPQALAAARHWVAGVWQRRRQRKALALLDGRLLRDVGLTRDDVRHELKKPFWQ